MNISYLETWPLNLPMQSFVLSSPIHWSNRGHSKALEKEGITDGLSFSPWMPTWSRTSFHLPPLTGFYLSEKKTSIMLSLQDIAFSLTEQTGLTWLAQGLMGRGTEKVGWRKSWQGPTTLTSRHLRGTQLQPPCDPATQIPGCVITDLDALQNTNQFNLEPVWFL